MRRLLIFVMVLMMAAMVLYFAVYALQRYSTGDQSLVCFIAFTLVGGMVGFWLLRMRWLARRLKRGVKQGFMSGYGRNRSE